MSKGSKQRPSSVPADELARRWEKAFGPPGTVQYDVIAISHEWKGEDATP